MKTLHLLCVLCALCGEALAAETRDLLLVAGQSNAVGYDAKPSELPADDADKQVMFWFRAGDPPPDEFDTTSGGKWTHLQPQPKGNPAPKMNGQKAKRSLKARRVRMFFCPLKQPSRPLYSIQTA